MSNFLPDTFFDLSDYEHAALFSDCTFVWQAFSKIKSYLKNYPLGKIEVEIPQGAFLVNPELISIGKGSVIEPGAYIKGPCILGENSIVRHGAYIRGDLITGKGCVIGHDTEVKHAIFLNKAHAAHFAYVGDSILGNNVNLGAGTKCANLKFDQSEIEIWFEGQTHKTGLRKFGAIIGDETQVGCNAVSNPGTLLGKKVYCYPCTNFGGVIASQSTVKSKEKCVITKR